MPNSTNDRRLIDQSIDRSVVLENFFLQARVVLRYEVLGVKLLAVLLVQLAHLPNAKDNQDSLGS